MVDKNITKEKKQSSSIWGGRFERTPSKVMEKINSSISFDKRLYKEDILASVAHAKMLVKQGIISNADGKKIISGSTLQGTRYFKFDNHKTSLCILLWLNHFLLQYRVCLFPLGNKKSIGSLGYPLALELLTSQSMDFVT